MDAGTGQVVVRVRAESLWHGCGRVAGPALRPSRVAVEAYAENPAGRLDLAACNPEYAADTVRYTGITTGGIVEAASLLECGCGRRMPRPGRNHRGRPGHRDRGSHAVRHGRQRAPAGGRFQGRPRICQALPAHDPGRRRQPVLQLAPNAGRRADAGADSGRANASEPAVTEPAPEPLESTAAPTPEAE